MKRSLTLLALVAMAGPAWASDGRLEINQACVTNGCFPGDTAGFPVTTEADRSYLLTSSLTLPDGDSIGVTLASGSTLDLGGFTIAGPVTCAGTPTVCTSGSGVGVYSPGAENVTIRNGTIRGTGNYGVRAGAGTRLEGLRIEQHTLDGVIADQGPTGWSIAACAIDRNGRDGLNFAYGGGAAGSTLRNSTIRRNAANGLRGGFSVVEGNAVVANGALGLAINYGGSVTAFAGNQIVENNGGNANPQTAGGIQTGLNVCGTDTVCP